MEISYVKWHENMHITPAVSRNDLLVGNEGWIHNLSEDPDMRLAVLT